MYVCYHLAVIVPHIVTTADIESAGIWPHLKESDDPELTRLASKLPATLLKSRADSSV